MSISVSYPGGEHYDTYYGDNLRHTLSHAGADGSRTLAIHEGDKEIAYYQPGEWASYAIRDDETPGPPAPVGFHHTPQE